jgi:glycosyltransferase involved in cell wall biosynthesis
MNNNGWQQARREVGLPRVRVHDLRHTYACRLRAAGVSAEDRAALLGHATQSMVGHYASADVGRLLRVEARHTHLVVDQSLLVPLAQTGALGGRTYEVFVHALPAVELQRRLDAAARRWPDVASLRDFRVSEAHCVMEAEALRRAQRLVTPHAEVARYLRTTFIGKPVDTIDWLLPPPRAERHARAPEATPVVAFAASALARKGALEMANAMRHLGWRLLVLGSPSSDPRLWHGIEVEHVAYRDRTWLARADVVALPALVEHSPRALLTAIAQGIPVVASPECGLSRSLGAIEVLAGDTAGLIAALLRALGTATKRTNAEARSCLHSRR